jgi:hypothetical protein
VLSADRGEWVGVGTLNLPADQRAAVLDLVQRYGQRHSSRTITIPMGCIQAVVHYTSRTPTHGHLREAFVVSVGPGETEQPAALDRGYPGQESGEPPAGESRSTDPQPGLYRALKKLGSCQNPC